MQWAGEGGEKHSLRNKIHQKGEKKASSIYPLAWLDHILLFPDKHLVSFCQSDCFFKTKQTNSIKIKSRAAIWYEFMQLVFFSFFWHMKATIMQRCAKKEHSRRTFLVVLNANVNNLLRSLFNPPETKNLVSDSPPPPDLYRWLCKSSVPMALKKSRQHLGTDMPKTRDFLFNHVSDTFHNYIECS